LALLDTQSVEYPISVSKLEPPRLEKEKYSSQDIGPQGDKERRKEEKKIKKKNKNKNR